MRNLLSLIALTALAQETFAANPTVDKVFATADGNVFLPTALNLARNHGRQEGLEVHEISRGGGETTDILDHIETDAKANELKQEAEAERIKAAAHEATPPATEIAVPIEAAAAAQAAGKVAAVEETAKRVDDPADQAPVVAPKKTPVADKAPAAAKKTATPK